MNSIGYGVFVVQEAIAGLALIELAALQDLHIFGWWHAHPTTHTNLADHFGHAFTAFFANAIICFDGAGFTLLHQIVASDHDLFAFLAELGKARFRFARGIAQLGFLLSEQTFRLDERSAGIGDAIDQALAFKLRVFDKFTNGFDFAFGAVGFFGVGGFRAFLP